MTRRSTQTKKLYGKVEIQAKERDITGGVKEKTVQVHVEVQVNSDIYTKEVAKTCHLTDINEIENLMIHPINHIRI